ncbi:hypothetical protein WICMUC_005620 [Wickerhamomyces mucosus]|uniref:Phosphoribulokinase/uridine kinase domain-containing protein n=1 Tax=Wickerhamomyces mucosus TaxID=1378264 RepID=A0A9P8P7L4_9ASCO|nr:hypothetical protein WICMUC_005620 [Wickerhamomyces mucosus]
MDKIETELTERVVKLYKQKPSNERLLIALAGSPGSGKSTISHHLISKINEIFNAKIAVVLDQDGYHYTREELSKFDDPEIAFKRRGAPFTFNPKPFVEVIKKLKAPINDSTKVIKAPTFNHEAKDPEPDSRIISPYHRIIIIEGNYVLLKDEFWRDISDLVDEKWKIKVDDTLARERIIKRHIAAGISQSLEEARKRCDENDMVNASYIRENSFKPDLTIASIDEVQS